MLKIQEKILIHQVRRGNQAAFSRFYNEYVDKIQRFVLFKVSSKEKAEELTNAIFTQILNYLLEGKEIKNFRAFLYQTARNLIIDFYRTKSKEISLDKVAEKLIKEEKYLEKELDLKLDLEKIEEGLKKIPDRYREVLILRFIEDLSFKEISKIIDENEANVRQLVHRGLKLLRHQLQVMSHL